jgi:hypothetical protein
VRGVTLKVYGPSPLCRDAPSKTSAQRAVTSRSFSEQIIVVIDDAARRPDSDVLSSLVDQSDAVLMDLRGFSSRNAGCVFEIGELFRLVPLDRVLFVVDSETDRTFLDQTFGRAAPIAASAFRSESQRTDAATAVHVQRSRQQDAARPAAWAGSRRVECRAIYSLSSRQLYIRAVVRLCRCLRSLKQGLFFDVVGQGISSERRALADE